MKEARARRTIRPELRRRLPYRLHAPILAAAAVITAAGCSGQAAPEADAPSATGVTASVSASKVDAAVRSVAPQGRYGVYDVSGGDCRRLHGLDAEDPMPIASAFKLWILDALAREIAAGRASWDETFPVADRLRSDPTGEVYPLPPGTPLTLRRYAKLMISISDNTATDHLLDRLGRQTVEATMVTLGVKTADRNTPLLSTADMARLKFVSPASGERYLALKSVAERRRFLEDLPADVPFPWQQPDGSIADVDLTKPRHVNELEWFATADDLCRTLVDLAALTATSGLEPVGKILAANPGVPPDVQSQWTEIRFKGGSEPGVLAFAYWLARADGARRVVVLGWSDPHHLLAPTPAGESAFRDILTLAHEIE